MKACLPTKPMFSSREYQHTSIFCYIIFWFLAISSYFLFINLFVCLFFHYSTIFQLSICIIVFIWFASCLLSASFRWFNACTIFCFMATTMLFCLVFIYCGLAIQSLVVSGPFCIVYWILYCLLVSHAWLWYSSIFVLLGFIFKLSYYVSQCVCFSLFGELIPEVLLWCNCCHFNILLLVPLFDYSAMGPQSTYLLFEFFQ